MLSILESADMAIGPLYSLFPVFLSVPYFVCVSCRLSVVVGKQVVMVENLAVSHGDAGPIVRTYLGMNCRGPRHHQKRLGAYEFRPKFSAWTIYSANAFACMKSYRGASIPLSELQLRLEPLNSPFKSTFLPGLDVRVRQIASN